MKLAPLYLLDLSALQIVSVTYRYFMHYWFYGKIYQVLVVSIFMGLPWRTCLTMKIFTADQKGIYSNI